MMVLARTLMTREYKDNSGHQSMHLSKAREKFSNALVAVGPKVVVVFHDKRDCLHVLTTYHVDEADDKMGFMSEDAWANPKARGVYFKGKEVYEEEMKQNELKIAQKKIMMLRKANKLQANDLEKKQNELEQAQKKIMKSEQTNCLLHEKLKVSTKLNEALQKQNDVLNGRSS